MADCANNVTYQILFKLKKYAVENIFIEENYMAALLTICNKMESQLGK